MSRDIIDKLKLHLEAAERLVGRLAEPDSDKDIVFGSFLAILDRIEESIREWNLTPGYCSTPIAGARDHAAAMAGMHDYNLAAGHHVPALSDLRRIRDQLETVAEARGW